VRDRDQITTRSGIEPAIREQRCLRRPVEAWSSDTEESPLGSGATQLGVCLKCACCLTLLGRIFCSAVVWFAHVAWDHSRCAVRVLRVQSVRVRGLRFFIFHLRFYEPCDRQCALHVHHAPDLLPARPTSPNQNRDHGKQSLNGKEIFMRLRLPARRSSPCAHHTIRLPRPPCARRRRSACPRYRDHRSRGTVRSWRLLP
jgi:hypothetical protein